MADRLCKGRRVWHDRKRSHTHLVLPLPLVARASMIQPQSRVFAPRGVEDALVRVRLAVVSAHWVPLLRAKLLA